MQNPAVLVNNATAFLRSSAGRNHRRTAVVAPGHAHIEVKAVHRPEHEPLRADVRNAIERLHGVNWAEVDAILGRVVVVFDPETLDVGDIVDTIETVEEAHDVRDEKFPHDRPDHPGDVEPIQRNLFALAADTAGLGVSVVTQALRIMPIPGEIPGIISLLDSQPRVRGFLEHRLGRPVADVTLAAANAFTQAAGQGPIGLVVDIAHRANVLGEQRARRAVWQRRAPVLVHGREAVAHAALEFDPRPTPLPGGPVEQYSDRAGIASMGAFGVALAATRDPRRASNLLLTGIPKAAGLGREAFAAQFGRRLADRGVIPMDQAALRRLDRVDTLVLEARVVRSATWAIDEVAPFDDTEDPAECNARARALFQPDDAHANRSHGGWRLAPLTTDEDALPRGAKNRARMLAHGGRHVLALWEHETLRALVAVVEEPAPLARELVERATRAGLDVMVAGGTERFALRLGTAHLLTERHLHEEVAALQREGHVVMVVGAHDHAALRGADVSLGFEVAGRRMPWGAHLMIGDDLANAWRIVDALESARDVSRRSALLAAAGASTGAVWAFIGPSTGAARRALLPINAAAAVAIAAGAVSGGRVASGEPPRPRPRIAWHELEPEAALAQLAASDAGLDTDERARRYSNSARVVRGPIGLLPATLDELANPLTPLLGLGAALSAAVGSISDAGLVIVVVGVNALVGAAQRVRTDRSLTRLAATGEHPVLVRVDGALTQHRPDDLVVGDVVELAAGETVPADCRILEAVALEVDESSLTGESQAVVKSADATPGAPVAERSSMLYEGTAIAAGRAVGVVVAVGSDTEAGRSAAEAGEPPPSGVERRLAGLTRLAVPVTVGAGAVVAGLGFLRRRPARTAVGAGVSLMVAAVPEGLPALATIAQIASARRLGGRGALVRNPHAIEALGRVDQICFDKTGTLTQGRIALACVSDGVVEEHTDALTVRGRAVLTAALRATPAPDGESVLPHATDRAVVEGAAAAGVVDPHEWERLDEVPFESARGYHAVLARNGEPGRTLSIKGAPEVVLPLVTTWRRAGASVAFAGAARDAVTAHVEHLARGGLRVLAVAEARIEDAHDAAEPPADGLELVGFVGLSDLVRPTAAAAVTRLTRAGIRVAMVTGDHPTTAEAIAAELGLLTDEHSAASSSSYVLSGAQLDELTDEELDRVIHDVVVFARVTPAHKVRIVRAFQHAGRTVAMTGDGANDASAIRLADAGIALGRHATAAARETADVVVVDERIETIVDAVIEGRSMWHSVRDAVAILVGGNLGELGFTLAGAAVMGSAPLNPRQLLLVNLLTDMAPALAIALREPADMSPEALLHAGPDASLGTALTSRIALRAATTAVGATSAWTVARFTGTPTRARTVALAALVGTQLGQTVVDGGRSPLVLAASAGSAALLFGVVQTPGLSQFFGCRPMGPVGWMTAASASVGATGASVVVPRAVRAVADRVTATRDAIAVPFLHDRASASAPVRRVS